jgi:hypothetical protein
VCQKRRELAISITGSPAKIKLFAVIVLAGSIRLKSAIMTIDATALINTRLQPGGESVQVTEPFQRLQGARIPLKRFQISWSVITGLKPGVNEMLVCGWLAFQACLAGCFREHLRHAKQDRARVFGRRL